jgi:hypothetical protein
MTRAESEGLIYLIALASAVFMMLSRAAWLSFVDRDQ